MCAGYYESGLSKKWIYRLFCVPSIYIALMNSAFVRVDFWNWNYFHMEDYVGYLFGGEIMEKPEYAIICNSSNSGEREIF